jgi:phage FluMu protein Com
MQIRCTNCHRPFAISKETVHEALDMIYKDDLSHFNVHCPHCRRANRLSPDQLKRAAPDWQPEQTPVEPAEE